MHATVHTQKQNDCGVTNRQQLDCISAWCNPTIDKSLLACTKQATRGFDLFFAVCDEEGEEELQV